MTNPKPSDLIAAAKDIFQKGSLLNSFREERDRIALAWADNLAPNRYGIAADGFTFIEPKPLAEAAYAYADALLRAGGYGFFIDIIQDTLAYLDETWVQTTSGDANGDGKR